MKHTSTLRSPYRARGLVTDAASTSTGDASLHQAALATKSLVVALCLARVVVDWLNGAMTFESLLAVAVMVFVSAGWQGSPCHDFGGALRVTDGQSREPRQRPPQAGPTARP